MANLAIKGHATRGKEVIEILEMLSGENLYSKSGYEDGLFYYLSDEQRICSLPISESYRDFILFTIEEFLKKFPYKVGDKVKYINNIFDIKSSRWDCEKNTVIYYIDADWSAGYVVETDNLQPYKEETMESKPNILQQLKEYFDNTPREVIEKEWHEYDKYNKIGPTVNEYLEYVNKSRQSQYPKTYEECCEIMGIEYPVVGGKSDGLSASTYRITEIRPFIYLLICRDAYWKIAGEQMGLGKPWEPDWRNSNEDKYCIEYSYGRINSVTTNIYNYILAFPTAGMRDAFYENFKDLIEQCKELL